MHGAFRVLALLVVLVMTLMSTATEAQQGMSVSSDGTVLLSEAAGTRLSKPFAGSGNKTEYTGAEPVWAEEALASIRDYPPMTVGSFPESVLGTDTRQYTYGTSSITRRVVYITGYQAGLGNYSCSGSMIGASTVLTAGHCVHHGAGGAFSTVSSIRVYPGRTGASAPYGSCTAKRLSTTSLWVSSSNANYDYGSIKLNCSIGNTTGWFGFYAPATVNGLPAIITGYPGDKSSGTQWTGADKIWTSTATFLYHKVDTYGGQSGSGIWWDYAGPYIYGVHAYGGSGYNSGPRMNSTMFNLVLGWKNTP